MAQLNDLLVTGSSRFLNDINANEVKTNILQGTIYGTGTAAQDKGSGVSPRYFPAKWTFNTGHTPVDGDIINITLPVAGHSWGDWVSIDNGVSYHPANTGGTGRLGTNYGVGTTIQLVFDADGQTNSMTPVNGADSVNGSNITGGCWRVVNYYDTNSNNYDRNLYNASIKCGSTAIATGNIIVGKDGVFHHLKDGTAFDINYPILYANGAIAANATSTNTYDVLAINLQTTQTITLTAYLPVFIKGTLSGNIFTPVSTTPLTQTVPTTADNYHYILLGVAYSTTNIYLDVDHRIFAYKNGKFGEVVNDAIYADSAGTATDSTKVAKAGDTMTGTLSITSTKTGNFNEGLRINRTSASNAAATLLIGGAASSTTGTSDGSFWIGAMPTGTTIRKLWVTHNGSNEGNTYFEASSSTDKSPKLHLGASGSVASGNGYAVTGGTVYDWCKTTVPTGAVFTDTKVTQTNSTTASDYRLLLSGSANDTTETTTSIKSTNFKANPSTGLLTVKAEKSTVNKSMLTGTGTAAQDKGSGVSPRYFPAKWTFNTGITVADGDMFTIKIPVAGHSYGEFISVNNGTNYYPVGYNTNSLLTTHFPVGAIITVVFKSDGVINSIYPVAGGDAKVNVSGGAFYVLDLYDSGNSNTYDRNRYQAAIKVWGTALVSGNVIVANTSGLYMHLKQNAAFDITYPILYLNEAVAANGTTTNTYDILNIATATTQSGTWTAYKPVFIKGQLSGTTFTPVSATPLTQTIPTTADGYEYILLGIATATTTVYLQERHPIYAYRNGKFGEIVNDADSVNGYTVAKSVPSDAKFTDTTYSVTSKTAAGLAPQLPNETTTTKYLRQDATWQVPPDTIPCAYCTTAAGTAAKVASCSSYVLTAKTWILVIIATANTSASALTLNINGKGAKTIYINGTASSSSNYTLPAGSYLVYYNSYYYFRTDGTLPGKAESASSADNASKVNNLTVQTAVPASALFTDANVAQTNLANTDANARRVLLSNGANNTTETKGSYKNAQLYFTPSTNTLVAGNFSGKLNNLSISLVT